MPETDELRQVRQQKLKDLMELGVPSLPNRYGPTRLSSEILRDFQALEGSSVRLAGRLMRMRLMGKASFTHIQDGDGQIQLYLKRDDLGEQKYEYFKLLDIGDIIGVEGTVFKTRTGETSIHVSDLILLAKALRPLPEKWHGLTDVETRYRRRYLDLISNEDARRIFKIRTAFISSVRRYLDDHGFLEVETPILQSVYGGAAATPFTTRYQALDADVYLRISDELYLKRLIVGGLERVYEIGKDFRNEGFSRKHSPEFTMLELYQAFADYGDMMTLFEDMIATAAQSVLGSRTVCFNDHSIDLTPPWQRSTMREAILQATGIDIQLRASSDELLEAVHATGRKVDPVPGTTRGKLIEEVFSELVESTLIQPTIVYDYPVDFPGGLLAKRRQDDPNITERFEVFMGGMEIANAFTELNEPGDQQTRMEEASRLTGNEHQQVDRDYVRALEHGMPPTGGLGFGIDRMIMIFTGARHIRETILFPLLRPRDDSDAES